MAGDRIAHGVVEIEVNDRDTLTRLNAIRSEFDATMKDIDRMEADVTIGGDLHQLEDDVANAKRIVRELEGKRASVKFDADKKLFDAQIKAAKAEVRELDGKRAVVEIAVRGEENVIKANRAAEDAARKRAAAEAKMQRDVDALAERTYKNNLRRVNDEARVRESLGRQRLREMKADEKMAYEMQRRRTIGVADEARQIIKLQGEYAKLTDRIERIDKKRPIGREARAKVHLEATSAFVEMEAVKARLNALGAHPPVEIKADLDRSLLQRAGQFIGRLGNKASGLSDLSVRLGPITTSLKGLTLGLSFLGPIITDLLGGASALVGVLGAGIAGAATVGAGAVTGLALGFGGLFFSMRNTKQEVTNARTAINAYQKAVQKYGAGSKQAKTAQDAMNNTLKSISPLARETAKGIEAFYSNWDKHTNATRKNFGQIAHDGFDALNAITPMWAARTNELSGMLAKGMHGAFSFIKSGQGRGLLDGIMGNFNAQVPTILHGLGSIGHSFLNIALEGSRNLGVLSHGFDNLGSKLLNWTQGDSFGATIKRWVKDAQDLMRFFGAAGRVIMHFFGAGSQAGDRFVNDMTRGLNRWDKFLTSVNGRKSVASAMEDAVTGTEKLWAVIAPIGGAFVEWAANLAPVVTGFLAGAGAVSHLVEFITRLVGMTGAVGTLAATLGAVWALGKIGAFVSLAARAFTIMRDMAKLGAAGGLASFFGLDGKGGFLGQLKQKASIAEGGAAAAAEMRAGIIEGGTAAAGELRAAMAGGGALGAGENIAARLAVPAGASAAIAETGVAAEAATIGVAGLSLATVGAIAGVAALAVGTGYLVYRLTRHKSETDKLTDAINKNNDALRGDVQTEDYYAKAQNRAVAGHRNATASLKDLHKELDSAKKGTVEYRDIQLRVWDAEKKRQTTRQDEINSARKQRDNTNQEIADARKQISLIQQRNKAREAEAQKAAALARARGVPMGVGRRGQGAPDQAMLDKVAAENARDLANAQQRLNQALNRRAAATLNVVRAEHNLSALSGKAAQQAGSLARQRPQLAQDIAVKYKLSSDVGNVSAEAKKALGQGVSLKAVLHIVADSKNAEDALRRLRTQEVAKKMVRFGISGHDGVLSMLSRIDRKAIRQKIARIIQHGGEPTLALINTLIQKQIRDKKFAVTAAVSQAIAAVDLVAAGLSRIQSKSIMVSVHHLDTYSSSGPGQGNAHGHHASGWTGRKAHVAMVGEGGGPEWGVDRKTGAVRRFNGPMVTGIGKHEAVVPTEARYRSRGRDIFKEIAKDLGLPMFAKGKKAKPPKPTTTNVVRGDRKGAKLNLTVFGQHKAARTAHAAVQTLHVTNPLNLPEVKRVQSLQQQEDDQKRIAGQAEGRLKEPDSFIKKVGEDVTGGDLYGVDMDAVNNWKAQLEHVRDLYTAIAQTITDLSTALPAAINAIQHAMETARQNIRTLNVLEAVQSGVINGKHTTTSERQAASAMLKEYQKGEDEQRKVLEDGSSNLGEMRTSLHELPFDYIDQQDQVNHYQDLIDALLPAARQSALDQSATLPDMPDPADLAIAKAESEGDVGGQIAGYNAKIAEAQALLADNNPYNDLQAYNDITSSKNAIASLQDTGSSGSGTGGSTDSTTPFAQQLMNLSTARSDLYKNFGSNFALAGSLGSGGLGPNIAGMGAYGLNPAVSGPGTNIVVNNSFPTPPPDPHTWSQGISWELQAAI